MYNVTQFTKHSVSVPPVSLGVQAIEGEEAKGF